MHDVDIHLNIDGARLVEVGTRLLDTGVNLLIDHFGWHDPKPRLAAQSYHGLGSNRNEPVGSLLGAA